MKSKVQISIKYFFDLIMLPLFFLYALLIKVFFNTTNRPKVFIGLMSNNNLVYVRDALRKRGYCSQVIPWIIPSHEQDVIDYDMNLSKMYPRIYKNFFGQLFLIYGLAFWLIYKYNVFIMPFRNRIFDRTGFLSWFEFELLHLAGKKIILNPYGGDIQFPEVWRCREDKASKELYLAWSNDPYYAKVSSVKTRKNNRYCQKHADAVILSIDWPDYLEINNCHFFHMRCVPKTVSLYGKSEQVNEVFRIVHATNHAHFKGTKHLESAIAEINKNGKICELILLQNTKNTEVLKIISQADVVFDQLLLGAYGRLAIEAMSLGKPVICYLREDFKALYNNWNECPIINANIDNIKEKIIELMTMSNEERQSIAKKSKDYVNKYHSSEYVGEKLEKIIQSLYKN